MYKGEDFVITIYCLLEDDLYPAFLKQHGPPRRAGFLPTHVLGEAAFIGLDRQQHHIHLLTPLKRNMLPTEARKPFVAPAWAPTLRRRIETVYAQWVQRFHVQAIKVRDAWHLQSLWTTKILTHSICVWLNIRLKRQPLDLDGLVQF